MDKVWCCKYSEQHVITQSDPNMSQTIPQLVLIRGLPGSGKSTLAQSFVEIGYHHFEEDQYFETSTGYTCVPRLVPVAHALCLAKTKHSLSRGNRVVVSNTFSRIWEMSKYIDLDVKVIQVIEVKGNYGNIHNVPDSVIQAMSERWETLDYHIQSQFKASILL